MLHRNRRTLLAGIITKSADVKVFISISLHASRGDTKTRTDKIRVNEYKYHAYSLMAITDGQLSALEGCEKTSHQVAA